MSFRITTLLYLFALVAASLAVFGAWGILVAGIVFLAWTQRRWWATWRGVVLFGLIAVIVLLVVPAVQYAHPPNHPPNWRTMSLNQVKQLMLAVVRYHDANKRLPPAYLSSGDGVPLLSWRVAILPYLDDPEGIRIYNQLRLNEPWDSAHNRPLLDKFDAQLFASPRVNHLRRTDPTTDYVAIVSPETIWSIDGPVAYRDVVDGVSNTIAIVEVGGLDIHWAEPRDVTLDQAVDLLTGNSQLTEEIAVDGYFTTEFYELRTRIAGYLDGHADAHDPLIHREDARALITHAGQENWEFGYTPGEVEDFPTRRLRTIIHWPHIWGVTVSVGLALLPFIPAARHRIWPSSDRATSPSTTPISED